MRKVEQRRIIDMLRMLSEANIEMRRLFSQGEKNSVIQVLADCQDLALAIGEHIEGIAGENTKTVSLLENYCEEAYQISIDVVEGNKMPNIFKRLDKAIIRIENNVRTELKPDRIEVAFMPYKCAMSDALESIWQAAFQDPQCDTYVVPIPYYDRLLGGAFGQMHDESGLYPQDIPITNWRTYNVEERHPDIIFIMYPYDDGNYITSLHPDYYSTRLKECCDLLAYVPYFVSVNDKVETTFSLAAGVQNADKVFLQSEAIRQIYMEDMRKYEKKTNSQGRFGDLEDKYIALGSPKFDAVVHAKPENYTLPQQWRTLIEKADGTKRKVIFYNTTIGAILESNEKYLKKLRSVLDFFKGRDDVVLWWRPHPLGEATYQTMRPSLLDAYTEIVTTYQAQGWGIYDDTALLHRAIALSDAYYGDWSSVVALYGVSGKPVLIQNVENLGFYTKINFGYSTFALDKGRLTFIPYKKNSLITMDLESFHAQYSGRLQNQFTTDGSIYSCVVQGENKAYFISRFDNEIVEYCFDTGESVSRPLALQSELKQPTVTNFITGCLVNQNLFLFPFGYGAIVKVDLSNDSVLHIPIAEENQLESAESRRFIHHCLIDHEIAYVTSHVTNTVLEFNINSYQSKLYRLGQPTDIYGYIVKNGSHFWIQVRNRPAFIQWDPQSGKEVEHTGFPGDFTNGNINFGAKTVIHDQNLLYCFPYQANMAVVLDMNTGLIQKADAFDIYFQQTKKQTNTKVMRCFMNAEMIYLFTTDGRIMQYNTRNQQMTVRTSPISMTAEMTQKLSEDALQALLDGREAGSKIKPQQDDPIGQAGVKILEHCKNVIGI
ncbi:MAG: hypothetical protein LBM69_09830, partial [Lachnospiraceae bacterium]|jgi:hypothetical protein|nr:hypothetical protein [Lachnospiraceae bacterium]